MKEFKNENIWFSHDLRKQNLPGSHYKDSLSIKKKGGGGESPILTCSTVPSRPPESVYVAECTPRTGAHVRPMSPSGAPSIVQQRGGGEGVRQSRGKPLSGKIRSAAR